MIAQKIAVAIVVGIALFFALRKIFRLISGRDSSSCNCSGCDSKCKDHKC